MTCLRLIHRDFFCTLILIEDYRTNPSLWSHKHDGRKLKNNCMHIICGKYHLKTMRRKKKEALIIPIAKLNEFNRAINKRKRKKKKPTHSKHTTHKLPPHKYIYICKRRQTCSHIHIVLSEWVLRALSPIHTTYKYKCAKSDYYSLQSSSVKEW